MSFSGFEWIEDKLRELNEHGTLNVLFSNGKELFAYRDRADRNGLCFTYRKAPFPEIKLKDEDWTVDLAADKKPTQRGFVIATRALTKGEEWTDLCEGALMVIRDGEAVYGDPRV